MKNLFLLLLFCCASNLLSAQSWTQQTSAPDCRYDGAGFTIGNKIYYGLGITCAGNHDNQFYVFDPALNSWSSVASFPGSTRRIAAGFAVNGKGYITMGIQQNGQPLNDVWEYDPQANTWTQKNNFPAGGRGASFVCATATKGYVGAGLAYMTFFSDFWEYNPTTDTWLSQTSFPGGIRFMGSAFAIGGACYALLGYDNNATTYNDCWKFDTLTNLWSACANFPGAARAQASAFALNGKGYAGYGNEADFYRYDPVANTWANETANGAGTVIYDFAVATATAGFCVSNYVNSPDCWKFTPLISVVNENTIAEVNVQISPNPSSGIFTISVADQIHSPTITVTDLTGRIVYTAKMYNNQSQIDLSTEAEGVYTLQVLTETGIASRRIVVAH
jgi:N-acetylneuraminic acid mutarotase